MARGGGGGGGPAAVLVVAAALLGTCSSKSDGTCGYQCEADADCGGCGTAGRCSCPNGRDVTFHQESCTCVSAPSNPPSEPAADVKDSFWPSEWTASVDAWCYGDFSNKTSVAKGKFYYNAALGRTRADWSPYISGKDAKQVWVGSTAGEPTSTYYVQTGPICLKFPITDPGQPGKPPVGVERPDWMAACQGAGLATYVGREQVHVNDEDVWVDHWSCRLDYAEANQSITFQNWHSLGLGSVPKGLPLRVTGGNSAPNPTRGSPRLNSVWYGDFVVGEGATQPSDFDPPGFGGKLCIPVDKAQVEQFFGHAVRAPHALSPAFHRRAHFLPHAAASAGDLRRARQRRPGKPFAGDSFGAAMRKLNAQLLRTPGLRTQPCHNYSLPLLHEMQRLLFDARTPELDSVYLSAGDTRRMAHASAESLEAEQHRHLTLHHRKEAVVGGGAAGSSALADVARDGACHEMVMWYVHHLSATAREAVREMLVLPLLPEAQHAHPAEHPEPEARDVHSRYRSQVSCAICHVTASDKAEAPSAPQALVV